MIDLNMLKVRILGYKKGDCHAAMLLMTVVNDFGEQVKILTGAAFYQKKFRLNERLIKRLRHLTHIHYANTTSSTNSGDHQHGSICCPHITRNHSATSSTTIQSTCISSCENG